MNAPSIAFYSPPITNAISASAGKFAFRIVYGIDILKNECDVTLEKRAKPDWAQPVLIELAPKCSSLLR